MERAKLIEMTRKFTAAFNHNDLDAVMSYFSDDGVYDEFNGRRNRGKAAIRAAFEPQFTGAFGKMEFLEDDLFVDAEAGKSMISWRCTLSINGKPTSWRGLDLLHFVGDCLVMKRTYAKAKAPLFEDQRYLHERAPGASPDFLNNRSVRWQCGTDRPQGSSSKASRNCEIPRKTRLSRDIFR